MPQNDSGNFSSPTPTVDSLVNRQCETWGDTRHLLLQAAHLCFAAAFVVPAVRRTAALFVVRLLLAVGFLSAGIWTALRSCAGPDALAWNATLLIANCAQAAYVAYRHLPPRIAPELQELYLKVFAPLKVGKDHFRQLIRHAHVEPLDPGEHYAVEGVTDTDQRLAILLLGKMKVTCEDVLLHYLLPTEFLDSPEWESSASNTDKRFQVTLTATEPCRLLCWGRKELLTILGNNQFLDVVMYNLIGKDITHKLYSLNEQHHENEQGKLTISESLEFFRSQTPRSVSVDLVHSERQDRRTSSVFSDNLADSQTSNYSDTSPFRSKRSTNQREEDMQFETPV